ncbi:MAG: hypothetical protein J6X33_01140 [Clostridiales bacterium]|nr:hypothetical protein [Clostridiales bacterium]
MENKDMKLNEEQLSEVAGGTGSSEAYPPKTFPDVGLLPPTYFDPSEQNGAPVIRQLPPINNQTQPLTYIDLVTQLPDNSRPETDNIFPVN